MKFFEKDLEDMIWENLQTDEGRELLFERGLDFEDGCLNYRQPSLNSYGIPDILRVGYIHRSKTKKEITISVEIIELKNVPLELKHISQICRYKKGVCEILDSIFGGYDVKILWNLSLIGTNKSDDFVWTSQQINDLHTYTFKFDLKNGLIFTPIGKNWIKTNLNLKSTSFCDFKYKNLLNSSTYLFQVEVLGMNKHYRDLKRIPTITDLRNN